MTQRTCTVGDCERPHSARGMCRAHCVASRRGRGNPDTFPQRFWAKVDRSGGADACWTWQARLNQKGYGTFESEGAHRVAYRLLVGPVPGGLQLDHLCRNTACVNPTHLDAVTLPENLRRAAAALTHCRHGHEYTPENTYVWRNARVCRTCRRERGLKWWRENKATTDTPAPMGA